MQDLALFLVLLADSKAVEIEIVELWTYCDRC